MDKEERAERVDITPDRTLHTGPRSDISPEDLVMASGRDVTPENLKWARRKLETEGRAAMEKLLP